MSENKKLLITILIALAVGIAAYGFSVCYYKNEGKPIVKFQQAQKNKKIQEVSEDGRPMTAIVSEDGVMMSGSPCRPVGPRLLIPELDMSEIEVFTKRIEKNPKDADAYRDRAAVFIKQGEDDKRTPQRDIQLRMNPQDPRIDQFLERSDASFGKAMNDLNMAIKLDPENNRNYFHRGVIYFEYNRNEEAFKDFTQAIELNPQDDRAYYYRALVNVRNGDYSYAIDDWNITSSLVPGRTFEEQHVTEIFERLEQPAEPQAMERVEELRRIVEMSQ